MESPFVTFINTHKEVTKERKKITLGYTIFSGDGRAGLPAAGSPPATGGGRGRRIKGSGFLGVGLWGGSMGGGNCRPSIRQW